MQRLVARPIVEQESDGVAQDLAKQPANQMPEVSRPHPLDGVTSRELTENGVDAVAKTAQEGAFLRSRISFLRGVRSQKVYAHPRQFLLRLGRMVVAIPDSDPSGRLGKFRYDGKLVDVVRGH